MSRSTRNRILRVLGASLFLVLPLGLIGRVPVGDDARAVLAWGVVVGSTVAAWSGARFGVPAALAIWIAVLFGLGATSFGHDAGSFVLAGMLAAVALWMPRERKPRPMDPGVVLAVAIAFGLVVWMLAAPTETRLDGDGPAHVGGVLDARDADRWLPPDRAVHDDTLRTDPRFGVLHGLYAAVSNWSGAPAEVVFARAAAWIVPLGFLAFATWMRAWSTPASAAAILALVMVLAGAGGRGFALWRAMFPGDAAVVFAGFAIAGISRWLQADRRSFLPVPSVALLVTSVAIHPFAWWLSVVCTGLAALLAPWSSHHRHQIPALLRVTLVGGLLGALVLLPRWAGREDSTQGIHQVATDVLWVDGHWFFVDPLALIHWGGISAFLVAPLLLLAPRTWWKRPWAPLAAATAVAAWLLALNPVLATPAWGVVAYLLIRTLRFVITPWWWWSLLREVRNAWPAAGTFSRVRSVVLVVAVLGLFGIDLATAWAILRTGPPREDPTIAARLEAMDRALDDVGAGRVLADPRTSYGLRARRGGVWPLVPAAHSNPEDLDLEARLRAFRGLQAAQTDSATWFARLDRLDPAWILVNRQPRAFAPYDEFGWIATSDPAERLHRRLIVLLGEPIRADDAWSLWPAPARADWTAAAARVDSLASRPDPGTEALAAGSRFEVVAVDVISHDVRAGRPVAVEVTLRARSGPDRTVHPDWEAIALRWRGPSAAVPGFARGFDKLYRKIVLERSARSAARFATERIPFAGTFEPEQWPDESVVVDRFEVRVPAHVTPGLYALELTVQERTWRPRRNLADILRDDDRYTGPVVATVEILGPAGR